MKEHTFKKTIKNSLVGGIAFFINFINSILVVPLFLKYWGIERYSDWITVQAIFSLFQLLDAGHRSYVSIELNISAQKDFEKARILLSSSLLFSVILACIPVILLAVLHLAGLFDFFFTINTNSEEGFKLFIALIILQVFSVFSGNTIAILFSLLYPLDKLFKTQVFGLFSNCITTIVIILIAVCDLKIIPAVICYSSAQFAISIATVFYVKKEADVFFPLTKKIDIKTGFKNLYKSLYVSLNAFMTQFSQNGIIILLSHLQMAIFIPKFTSIRTIGNLSTKVSSIFATATIFDIAKYHLSNEPKKINSILHFNWIVSGFIFNAVLLLIDPFIEGLYMKWTQGVIPFDRNFYLMIIISASFVNYGFILGQYFVVINDIKNQNYALIIKFLGLFIPIFFAYKALGIYSIGIGLIVSELLGSIIIPFFLIRKYNVFNANIKFPLKEFIYSIIPMIILLGYYITSAIFGFKLVLYILFFLLIPIAYFLNWRLVDDAIKSKLLRNSKQ